jgi:Tfp pilus assembly protein PilO
MSDEPKPKSRGLKVRLVAFCYKPMLFRAALTAVIVGAWYAGFAMPSTAEIDQTATKLAREQKRLGLAREVEELRKQVARYQKRLPVNSDPNEWVQYMLDGVRKFPTLRLVMLDTDGTKAVGPYNAILIKLNVEGPFRDVDAFVRWIEANPRLLRVDMLNMQPVRSANETASGRMGATMIVMGVMG